MARAPLALLAARPASPGVRLLLLATWVATIALLVARHSMWRDEVRALSLALTGDSVIGMLRAIHGEGHPALWYLLLRLAYMATGTRLVLPGVALAVGVAAASIIAARAPFRWPVIAVVLFSGYALMDYTVVARNYGLSMLIVAAIAWRYRRWRDRGVGLGLLLFLLCNTNAPSILVAGGLLLFRAGELLSEQGLRPTAASRHLLWTAGLAALGVLTCAATLYPPYNDAVGLALGGGDTVPIAGGFRLPIPFDALTAGLQSTRPGALLFIVILVGSILGLARAPAALAAATVLGLGFELFFRLVYPGFYRHQALFVLLLIALYWLVAQGFGGRWPERIERRWQQAIAAAERYGSLAFAALLALQCVVGIGLVVQSAQGAVFSRSADLAALLERPALRQAVVIANPDLLLEPLPYYVDNPAWIVRERRWGHVTAFTKAAMRDVSLAELLATAQALRAKTRRPVVIVVSRRLDAAAPPQAWRQGYLGRFLTTPAQVRAFLGATRRLARFAPAVTDESYDVYLLR